MSIIGFLLANKRSIHSYLFQNWYFIHFGFKMLFWILNFDKLLLLFFYKLIKIIISIFNIAQSLLYSLYISISLLYRLLFLFKLLCAQEMLKVFSFLLLLWWNYRVHIIYSFEGRVVKLGLILIVRLFLLELYLFYKTWMLFVV